MTQRYPLFPLFLLLFLVYLPNLEAGNLRQGYIITKTDHHLTGYIGEINHTQYGSMVEFINDFGTPYFLHPALIKGFAFLEGPAFRQYESKYWRRQWMFLQVIYPGEDVRLLQSPDLITSFQIVNGKLSSNTKEKVQYWIDLPDRRLLRVKRWGFRQHMRRLVEDVSPNLADKIGRPGYRYRDLVSIIQEYDRILRQGTRRL
jgi:hypothetical protein